MFKTDEELNNDETMKELTGQTDDEYNASYKMDYKKILWWKRLSESEQNVLIELLYNLELMDYVEMDADGEIVGLKELSDGN